MRHQRPPSYTSNRGPDWSGSSPAGNRLKSQSTSSGGGGSGSSNNVTSPNPYAPSFVSSSSSPWTTPSGSSSNSRYKPRGSNSSNAARTLFPGSSSGGSDDKYFHKSSSSNWDDHASESGSSLGGSELSGGDESSSLLRSNQPVHENWESYADGQTSSHPSTLPSQANTEPASLNLTPADSPSLGPYRSGDLGDKLVLDERGTDISLSTLKKEGLSGDISIHMLSLLYDPPVQGCELKPYVSVVDGNNRVTAVTTDDHGLDFRWFRGQKRICSNTTGNCNKAATIQCVSCAKLSANLIPQHLTYFCSEKCLKENWQQHKQLHMQQHVQKREPSQWSFDEEESDETVRPDSPSHLHCKYPSVLANTWQETSTERSYVPSVEDVGRSMRLECAPVLKTAQQKDKREKELEAAKARGEAALSSTSQLNSSLSLGSIVRIDTGAVIPTPLPPPPRTLLYTDPSNPVNASNTFRTVCYNVLAQIYATRQVYPYTAIWALAWEYRKNLLLREIVSHNADIICLQEVQSNHFYSFFQPELAAHGYEGTFKNKTRDAGSDSGGNQVIDGCATFFKRDRFALMEQYGIEFNEAARQQTSNRQQLRRLLKGNIALVLVLEELTPPPSSSNSSAARRNRKRRLCITNTHIFWDPEFPEVKLWQTWILCQELEKLVLPRNLPLLLCGDFNSLVDSSVYELLSTERVEPGEDVFGSTGDPTHLLPAPHSVTHRLPLLSAYGSTLGEPKYTNYTGSFVGVLDYIFFTRTHLRCVACLDVDDESLLRQHTALPSPHYSSDHLPLVTILEFLDA